MDTRVIDLRDPTKEYFYSLPPETAVRNAYAYFELHDGNTWQYEKYNRLVITGMFSVSCGDYTALKEINLT